jgi:hypothetical protein
LLRLERKGGIQVRRYKSWCCSIEFYSETSAITRYPKTPIPPPRLEIDDCKIDKIPVQPTRPIAGTIAPTNPRDKFSAAKRSSPKPPRIVELPSPPGKMLMSRIPESLEDALDLAGVLGRSVNADRLAVVKSTGSESFAESPTFVAGETLAPPHLIAVEYRETFTLWIAEKMHNLPPLNFDRCEAETPRPAHHATDWPKHEFVFAQHLLLTSENSVTRSRLWPLPAQHQAACSGLGLRVHPLNIPIGAW